MAYKNIWFLSTETGEWTSSEDSITIKFHEMIQRMQTWENEKPFNAEDGIDYLSVFNRQKFLVPELEDIASEYYEYFDSITIEDVSDVTINSKNEYLLTIKIVAILLTGNKYSETIVI